MGVEGSTTRRVKKKGRFCSQRIRRRSNFSGKEVKREGKRKNEKKRGLTFRNSGWVKMRRGKGNEKENGRRQE